MVQTMIDQEERDSESETRIRLGAYGVVDSMPMETVDFLIGALVQVSDQSGAQLPRKHQRNRSRYVLFGRRESKRWSQSRIASHPQWESLERCVRWL